MITGYLRLSFAMLWSAFLLANASAGAKALDR